MRRQWSDDLGKVQNEYAPPLPRPVVALLVSHCHVVVDPVLLYLVHGRPIGRAECAYDLLG